MQEKLRSKRAAKPATGPEQGAGPEQAEPAKRESVADRPAVRGPIAPQASAAVAPPNIAGKPPPPHVLLSTRQRLDLIRGWLLAGKPTHDVLLVIQDLFGVKRRQSFRYLALARRQMILEAESEGRTLNFCKTQWLRDRLIGEMLRQIEGNTDGKQLRALSGAVQAVCKLLDSRDNSTDRVFQSIELESDGQAGVFVAGVAALARQNGEPPQTLLAGSAEPGPLHEEKNFADTVSSAAPVQEKLTSQEIV